MINLSNIAVSIKDVNPVWTFSHYCNVPAEQFNGATIKIKSIFHPDEKTPSMLIYRAQNAYKFNCFSTATKGDHIDLVQAKFNLNYTQSCRKIMTDYTRSVISGKEIVVTGITPHTSYKVKGTITREWTQRDKAFFLPYDIGMTALNWGGVKPLAKYQLDNGSSEMIIEGEAIYGYFSTKGVLYKIYQPTRPECKFLTVNAKYDFGKDHKEGNKHFVIVSSLKDGMALKDMGLSLDIKVPASESTYFLNDYIRSLKKQYKSGFTLLDNDAAGKKSMLHYKQQHDINFVWLDLSKDYSDSIRDHGKNKVRSLIIPLIHKAINK